MNMDKLDELFERQIKFQIKCGTNPNEFNIQNYKDQTLALIAEVFEALKETAWKPWKKQQQNNIEKIQEELIDVWHFLINLSLLVGMDSNSLFDKFCEKNRENFKRQDEGY
jgi:dimeric dUTPase (all-alpha-NTP-PPase superfamily)